MKNEELLRSAQMISRIFNSIKNNGISQSNIAAETLNLDESEGRLFHDAMIWLQNEGLIHVQNTTGMTKFLGCTLSAKSFALLGYRISLDGDELTFEAASELVEEGKVSSTSIADFLGAFTGGFTKSMGNG